MVVRAFVFETRGGAQLAEFEPELSWQVQANTAEQVDVTIDLNGELEGSRGWRNLATPWKHSIALDVGGRYYGGPIMPHDYQDDNGQLKLVARGIRVMLARRSIMPATALTGNLLTPAGAPNPTFDSTFTGDLGTIGKKVVQQACTWPGWTDIPITFQDNRSGTESRTYPAIERVKIDPALSDLSNVEGGPDFRFTLIRVNDSTFGWRMESGTAVQPRLQSIDEWEWDISHQSGLAVQTDPTRMGSLSWAGGGRTGDRTLLGRRYDPYLIDRGFPLLELEASASSNTDTQAILDAANVETLRTARRPWEFWSFKVPADKQPFPSQYQVGDILILRVPKEGADIVLDTVTADVPGGDRVRYVEPGEYRRRIAALSGDTSDWVSITCGEVY